MVIKGTNVVANITPQAVNALNCPEYFVTDSLQWSTDFTQFNGTRRIWGTRSMNFTSLASWFNPNGGTKINLFNEEEWFDPTFTPAQAIPILQAQIDQCKAIDPTCHISWQCGVQMNCIGLKEGGWGEQVILGLSKEYRKKIDAINVHLYPAVNINGQLNYNLDAILNPNRITKWLKTIRDRMDVLGMASKEIIIGEVGLTDRLKTWDANGNRTPENDLRIDLDSRTPMYLANLYQAINALPELNVSHIFPYCAGTHIGAGGDFYISLGEGDTVSVYGANYAAA